MSTDRFVYRLEGALTDSVPVGPVADGIRADNAFEGTITEGELRGAHVRGTDHFRIRSDGVGIVDAREVITLGDHVIACTVTGYILPPDELPVATPEVIASPDFAWPDVPFAIEALATFETASPAHAHLNRLAVVHTGSVNMATGRLVVEAHRLGRGTRPAEAARDVYAGYPDGGR